MKGHSTLTLTGNIFLSRSRISRLLVAVFFVAASWSEVYAQTNPTAQSLPYSQNFTSLAASSTVYPTGWQGWQVSTASSSAFRTNAATGDLALQASSTAATTAGGIHNYNGKIGLLASGSVDPSIAFAIVTTGVSNVTVSFDVMTI